MIGDFFFVLKDASWPAPGAPKGLSEDPLLLKHWSPKA